MTACHKALSIFTILILIILPSCAGEQTLVTLTATVSPTTTFTPSPTLTVTPTLTSTATPTPRIPVMLGTQMPASNVGISAENIDRVVELARWGKGVITDATYSPDGKVIAIATTLGVSLYRADALDEILYFETDASVTSIAFTPDGETLATGWDSNTVNIWNVSDGSLINSLQNQKEESPKPNEDKVRVITVAFSPDGKLLASGLSDGTLNVWQISDASLVLSPKTRQGKGISGVFFSPDGNLIYSSAYDGTTYSRNVVDGKTVRTFGGRSILVSVLSVNGKLLITYDRQYTNDVGKLVIWDTESGKKLQTINAVEEYSGNNVSSLAVSPNGLLLAAGFEDHTIKTWNLDSGVLQNKFDDMRPKDGWSYFASFDVEFSPDGQFLILAGADMIGIWGATNGNLVKKENVKSEICIKLAISPDKKILASVEGPNLYLRQIADGNLVPVNDRIQSNGDVRFMPDGNTLVVSMFDSTARFWPLTEQGMRKSFEMEQKENVEVVALAPDGGIIAIAGYYPTGKLELRQISDGLVTQTFEFRSGHINNMEFSPDGKLLITSLTMFGADLGEIRLFSVVDGKQVKLLRGNNFALSQDGLLLAGGGENNILNVWKIPSGEVLSTLKNLPDVVHAVTFSPDGKYLVSGTADGTIEVFLISNGTLLRSWKGHTQLISDLLFTSDGKYLISASYDGTIRTWGIKP